MSNTIHTHKTYEHGLRTHDHPIQHPLFHETHTERTSPDNMGAHLRLAYRHDESRLSSLWATSTEFTTFPKQSWAGGSQTFTVPAVSTVKILGANARYTDIGHALWFVHEGGTVSVIPTWDHYGLSYEVVIEATPKYLHFMESVSRVTPQAQPHEPLCKSEGDHNMKCQPCRQAIQAMWEVATTAE